MNIGLLGGPLPSLSRIEGTTRGRAQISIPVTEKSVADWVYID